MAPPVYVATVRHSSGTAHVVPQGTANVAMVGAISPTLGLGVAKLIMVTARWPPRFGPRSLATVNWASMMSLVTMRRWVATVGVWVAVMGPVVTLVYSLVTLVPTGTSFVVTYKNDQRYCDNIG